MSCALAEAEQREAAAARAVDQGARPEGCAVHHHHTGGIELVRQSKSRAKRGAVLARWSCCKQPLVRQQTAPVTFVVLPEAAHPVCAVSSAASADAGGGEDDEAEE
jgi:hypothetical protein